MRRIPRGIPGGVGLASLTSDNIQGMGHFCRICQQVKANERFSGGGHRIHVCSDCQRLPIETRRAIEADDLIEHILCRQTCISAKNVAWLTSLSASADRELAERAAIMVEIARVAPRKRKRLGRIRHGHPELWQRMVTAGLVVPDSDPEGPPTAYDDAPGEGYWPAEDNVDEDGTAPADDHDDGLADDELPF